MLCHILFNYMPFFLATIEDVEAKKREESEGKETCSNIFHSSEWNQKDFFPSPFDTSHRDLCVHICWIEYHWKFETKLNLFLPLCHTEMPLNLSPFFADDTTSIFKKISKWEKGEELIGKVFFLLALKTCLKRCSWKWPEEREPRG